MSLILGIKQKQLLTKLINGLLDFSEMVNLISHGAAPMLNGLCGSNTLAQDTRTAILGASYAN